MPHDREIAGIRCTEILAGLSDYLDDELPASTRTQIEAHLAACTWCEQFGGEFTAVVSSLRQHLSTPPSIGEDATEHLLDLLGLEAS